MHSAVAAAQRLRPRRTVTVLNESFVVRMPSMADIRVFQELRKENAARALSGFLQGCVLGDNDAQMTSEEADELADCHWISQPLLTKIMRFSNGQPDEPTASEAEPAAGASDGELPTPPVIAG